MCREICPCKDCSDRFVDEVNSSCCRTTCVRYADWKKNDDIRKKQISDYMNKNSEIRSFKKEQVEKALRRRRS